MSHFGSVRVYYRGLGNSNLFLFHADIVEQCETWHESVRRSVGRICREIEPPAELTRWFSKASDWDEMLLSFEAYANSGEYATDAILPTLYRDPLEAPLYRWQEDGGVWRLEAKGESVAIVSDEYGIFMCVSQDQLDRDFDSISADDRRRR